MASGPKIVHKQFNSPIGLYSQQNIAETLDKHITKLDNGSVGINFGTPGTEKPANLANSAVLRMLEEEERNRNGKLDPTQVQAILETLVRMNHRFDQHWPPASTCMRPARSWDGHLNTNSKVYSEFMEATKGYKKVVWPPASENHYHQSQQPPIPAYHNQQQPPQQPSPQPQHSPQPRYHQQSQKETIIPVQHYKSPQPSRNGDIPIPVQHYKTNQAPSAYQAPSTNQAPSTYQDYQQEPAYKSSPCEGLRQEKCGLSRLIPVGPGVTASPAPAPYRPGPPSPASYRQPPQNNRWAPVASPLSPQSNGSQNTYPAQSLSPAYSPSPYSPQPDPYQRAFEPPPSTITLRQQAPIHQRPAPVYNSQPAAASFRGGVNMRGDQKWPPQAVREAVDAENDARRQLAKGPACRPRKVNKDYSSFFAQNALNNNYPGYRAPPGTQHYEDQPGRSFY